VKKLSYIFIIFVIQILIAENTFPLSPTFNPGLIPYSQGGVLEFSSESVERFGLSLQNSDSLVLKNYSGLPLKALQFKIIIGKDGGKLNFKSITRGSSIPESSFLLDYEVHEGQLQSDGSSIDVVSVVLLGWGEKVLLPGETHYIISINYDVVDIENDSSYTNLSLNDVLGATSTPVQDANIIAGEDETIYLRKPSVVNNEKMTLLQNYPNPFNPVTTINYTIAKENRVILKIFNSIGEEVAELVNEYKAAGEHKVNFDSGNLSSGTYFYQIKAGSYYEVKKMTLVK
jgi:hypothetical protein